MKKLYLILIISTLMLLVVAGCGKQEFDGSCTANDVQFIVDYKVLNCTKIHEMELVEGSAIDVMIENKSGRLDILITDSSGEKIYKGDDASSGEFSFEILKTDTY